MTLDHPHILETCTLDWPDEGHCERFAAALAARPAIRRAFIELHGPLGAGKTTFVRHLLRALGVTGRIRSPTYALMEPYLIDDLAIAHLDLYRLQGAREWADTGLREVLGEPGLKLIEWPENAGGALPVPDLALHIAPTGMGEQRQVRLDVFTALGRELAPA